MKFKAGDICVCTNSALARAGVPIMILELPYGYSPMSYLVSYVNPPTNVATVFWVNSEYLQLESLYKSSLLTVLRDEEK